MSMCIDDMLVDDVIELILLTTILDNRHRVDYRWCRLPEISADYWWL